MATKQAATAALAVFLSTAAVGQDTSSVNHANDTLSGTPQLHKPGHKQSPKFLPSHVFGHYGFGVEGVQSRANYISPSKFGGGVHWHNPINSKTEITMNAGANVQMMLPFGRPNNSEGNPKDSTYKNHATIASGTLYAGVGSVSGDDKFRLYFTPLKASLRTSLQKPFNAATREILEGPSKFVMDLGLGAEVRGVFNKWLTAAFDVRAAGTQYENRMTGQKDKKTDWNYGLTLSMVIGGGKIRQPKTEYKYNDGNSQFIPAR